MTDRVTVEVEFKGRNSTGNVTGAVRRDIDQTRQSVAGLNQQFTQFNNALGMIGAGVSLMAVKGWAEDLYASGVAAQRAETMYRSFGAQVGDTDALLSRLRATTRGVVEDVDLMNAANSMLSMGLAKNADDVQRLTSIAATFAQATGQDVGESLENLNSMLANNSYLRLDTLGVSSSQVRKLVTQYTAAGMDSSEAFTQAFLDVADEKMPQMAAVADATVTALQQLQTSVDNWWADFGDRFAQGVNGMIGLAGLLAAALRGVFDAPGDIGNGSTTIAGGFTLQDNLGGSFTIPDMVVNGDSISFAQGYSDADAATNAAMQAQIAAYRSGSRPTAPQVGGWWNAFANPAYTAPTSLFGGGWDGATASGLTNWTAIQQQQAALNALLSEYQTAAAQLDQGRVEMQLRGSFGSRDGVRLFSEDQAQEAESVAAQLTLIADRVDELSDDDAFVQQFRGAAEQARVFADEVQRGADALASLSLSELFGQTSGGRLGEIDSAILASLQAGGAPQETLDALARAMGLDTGQLTDMSVQFEDQVVPFLSDMASQMGADAYNTMRRAYDDAVAHAALTGQSTVDMASLMGGYAYYPGSGGSANAYTVKPGDTLSGIAAQYGMTAADLAAQAGVANPSFIRAGQTLNWGSSVGGGGLIDTNFDLLEGQMMAMDTTFQNAETSAASIADDMTTAVDTLSTGLDKLFSKRYALEIDLSVLGKDKLAQLVAEIVQGNGGTAPGTTNTSGKSGGGFRGGQGR